MAKITPVLWKHKDNGDGHCPIYLRIYSEGKTKYKSLSVYIHPRHWNDRTRRVRKSHRRFAEINALITDKLSEAEGAVVESRREGRAPTAQELKEALQDEVPSAENDAEKPDFFAYAKTVRERFRQRDQIHSVIKHKAVASKLKSFAGEPLQFEEITPEFLRDWETHLIKHHGNAQSTAASNLRAVRSVLYKAIRDGHLKQSANPFFQFKINRGNGPDRDKLSKAQVQKTERLNLEEGSLIWHVRNYFLFSLYGAGVRFSDVAHMKESNIVDDRLVYRMQKTGKEKSVKLLPQALSIVDYYLDAGSSDESDLLFPILEGADLSTEEKRVYAVANQNALVNKYLKKIADQAKLKGISLSFHVARHSFATIALRAGWGVAEISQALGHSSLKVTEQYLKGFDDTDLDDKMETLFGGATE